MKISASIYARHRVGFSSNGNSASADELLDIDPARPLRDTVRMLDEHGVDYFHIDCRDDHAVFEDIKLIRTVSKTPIDLHLITPDPEPYYPAIRELGIECVSVQLESLEQIWKPPSDLKNALGLAMISATSIDAFSPFADSLSFVLFMTTTPGQSGGEFHNTNFRKIREFQAKHPSVRIHVDGGVNQEVSFILRNMGVYAAVSGSYLLPDKEAVGPRMLKLTRPSIPTSIQSTTSEKEQAKGFIVADFMMLRHEIPLLRQDDLTLAKVLQCIEAHKMGFCIIEDDKQKLKGIISNADIRRGLLQNLNDFNAINPQELINTNPFAAKDDLSVSALLGAIKACSFPILYLPVTGANGKVTGALKFNNLIKGEL